MSVKWMGLLCAAAVCVVLAFLTVGPAWTPTAVAQAPFVQRVNPRPRLAFAPGEYRTFLAETSGARRPAFERLLSHIDNLKSRNWNERDLQMESQALVARVFLDRRDPRGANYLGLARQTMRGILERQMFQRFSESHALVTEGARQVEAIAFAHDWLHPYWTADERAAMAGWLRAEIDNWVDGDRLARASASPFRNDAARGTVALVLAGLTLFDEGGFQPTARKALGYASPYYTAMLGAHAYAGGGGGMTEGTFYGNFTAWAQVLLAEALYTGAGMEDAFTRSRFYEGRLRYAAHGAWPGYLTNQFGFNVHQLAPIFGDARRGPTGSAFYHRATVLLLGKRLADSPAAREAYWVVNRDETSRTSAAEWGLFDLLYWSPAVRREPPTALAYREPTLGQVFARSDWTDDATWVSFNAGPHLDTHQHYDAGNLTIFRGVDLLVDSGSLDAFGTNHWYNYYVRTVAHNTITVTDPEEQWNTIWGGVPYDKAVNDGGQRTAAPLTPSPTLDEYLANRSAYDHGRIERYVDGDWGLYVRANLTNAYQNPEYQTTRPNGTRNRPKVTHVGREVVYLRRADDRRDAVVVFDRVVSTDPSFRKAVLWHSRESFDAQTAGRQVDEGERRFEGESKYDFETLVRFKEGPRERQSRLFVTALAVDPIVVREIGRRVPTTSADHKTFNVEHHHRHVKDYFVQDPRGIMNDNHNTGALGRPEWPPINPPEQQWLWTDDLVGGWGQTRLEIEPSGPRLADRFLTVLVPSNAGEAARPRVDKASSPDGSGAAAVIRDGSRMDVVLFSADPGGGPLVRTAIDVPANPLNGELIITTLEPGGEYFIRARTDGAVQRIAISRAPAGITADAAGMIRVRLDRIARARLGQAIPGAPAFASAPGGTPAATSGEDSHTAAQAANPGSMAQASGRRHPGLILVDAADESSRMRWNARVDDMIATGELRLREGTDDSQVPGRRREHLAQMYQGVPVFGGALTRQWDGGSPSAIYGTLYANVAIETVPRLTAAEAASRLQAEYGAPLPVPAPELMILPTGDGRYRLAYRVRVVLKNDTMLYFVEANTGEGLLKFSDLGRPVM